MTLYQQNAYSKIFLESSIVACINFSVMPLKGKCLCLSRPHSICWPIFTTFFPIVSFFQLFKKPKMESLSFFLLELYLGKCIWIFLCRRKQQRELRNCQTWDLSEFKYFFKYIDPSLKIKLRISQRVNVNDKIKIDKLKCLLNPYWLY